MKSLVTFEGVQYKLSSLESGRQIQQGGLERVIRLEQIGDEITNVLRELGQVEFAGLATPSGEVVHAGDAGVELMQGLANRVVSPAEVTFGLTLAEVERLDRFGHV